ncbi:MAG TPA: acetyl-CoA carboxylase biotin carboxyl carrier protein subunit [Candidatus Marinimicrobia bacterium]|nr:acetyl-CoA carboxylase biotin carboxyl carrier protein subunit [Candidatus Neomarinimicrobiota bacterium]
MKIFKFLVNGNPYEVKIKSMAEDFAKVECNGIEYELELLEMHQEKKTPRLVRESINPYSEEKAQTRTHKPGARIGANFIKAPIPGLITAILVKPGDTVKSGDIIAKMEAMKMENNILASVDGVVKAIDVKIGDSVLENDVIITMEA